jgi:hypothetical protein
MGDERVLSDQGPAQMIEKTLQGHGRRGFVMKEIFPAKGVFPVAVREFPEPVLQTS